MLKFIDRKNSNCVKWDINDRIFGRKDVISLWVADMDFESPEVIVNALKKRLEHHAFGYTVCRNEFYESIILWLKKRFNWNVQREWITVMPGVVPTLVLSILTFTKPGDKVLIQSPVYFPFFRSIEEQNRTLVDSPLINNNNDYEMDFEDLEAKFKDGVKMMLLCSPHNPVGRVWSKSELSRLAELCTKYQVLLLSDEIHSDLVFNSHKHLPLPTISPDIEQNSITAIAPGKTFNIAGNTVSIAIIPNKDIFDKFYNSALAMGFQVVNLMGVEAFTAAYKHGEPWVEELLPVLWDNYLFAKEYIENNFPKIKVTPLQGTYLMWLDCREIGLPHDQLVDFFVKEAGLGLNDGAVFGKTGEGYMRLNLATSREILKDALELLLQAYKNRNF